MDLILFIFILVVAAIVLMVFLYFIPVALWISALAARVHIGIGEMVGMRLRRVPPNVIVNSQINASKAGVEISTAFLEAHFLAGGEVSKVVGALIAADKAGITLTTERAAAIDLAGRDVFEAVQVSVNPKVISTPMVTAVAKDGIQVKATSRVTVRANIERLVGGAGEETFGVEEVLGEGQDILVDGEFPEDPI